MSVCVCRRREPSSVLVVGMSSLHVLFLAFVFVASPFHPLPSILFFVRSSFSQVLRSTSVFLLALVLAASPFNPPLQCWGCSVPCHEFTYGSKQHCRGGRRGGESARALRFLFPSTVERLRFLHSLCFSGTRQVTEIRRMQTLRLRCFLTQNIFVWGALCGLFGSMFGLWSCVSVHVEHVMCPVASLAQSACFLHPTVLNYQFTHRVRVFD